LNLCRADRWRILHQKDADWKALKKHSACKEEAKVGRNKRSEDKRRAAHRKVAFAAEKRAALAKEGIHTNKLRSLVLKLVEIVAWICSFNSASPNPRRVRSSVKIGEQTLKCLQLGGLLYVVSWKGSLLFCVVADNVAVGYRVQGSNVVYVQYKCLN